MIRFIGFLGRVSVRRFSAFSHSYLETEYTPPITLGGVARDRRMHYPQFSYRAFMKALSLIC